ncbi:4-alpha-glucanotransferase [Rhizobium sp. RU36D]|uniref:4-alpha-glucanotransferase n=1 Tax=Rhizobium sp. RU36D TaxID=1907415 RepID=UPI0009D828C8|nr:4-alpha-glucanotransferase [Rhizobium sp. RU36D]SMC87468.1 4-alpha-glucanotransferase [Rhizobium sp. RU36D]
MKTKDIDQLARQHGISLTRPSPADGDVRISNDTKQKVLEALRVDMTSGVKESAKPGKVRGEKAVPPSFLPEFLHHERVWGISLQLYELRSERNWGIGDFEDLKAMADLVESLGGDFIGLNPLHAPFLADPIRCSPYEPSNRQHVNPLYIAVDKVPGFKPGSFDLRKLQALRKTELVDYAGVAALKLEALRQAWEYFRQRPEDMAAHWQAFESFVDAGGEILFRHCLFESLSLMMVATGHPAGWLGWPREYQDCHNDAVTAYADENREDVRFHMWLQWLAHTQLEAAAHHARDAGLRIGLYLDLAVGEAVDGSATWSERDVYLDKATIGSPPDPFAPDGQDWHLAAFHPDKIAEGDNAPFRRMVSVAMRYAGAVRIDHAAALRRLFLVPLESRPDGGAYVDYPQQALLEILAEASARYRCLVIGEDLGILPPGLQDDLEQARILSYRILSYEREGAGFKPAGAYRPLALACISTHDHQTLVGWWRGADIEARDEHGIIPPETTREHRQDRKLERSHLLKVLRASGIAVPARLAAGSTDPEKLQNLVVGAHRFIARTPSMLVAVRLADLTDEKRPTNIPGTSDSYPNWQPKLSKRINELDALPVLQAVANAMREERPRTLD